MASNYQNFGNPNPMASDASAPSYDDRLPTSNYGTKPADESTDYSNYGAAPPAEEDGFHATTPRTLLRFAELLLSMIAFAVGASVHDFSHNPPLQYQVVAGVFAFLYAIFMLAADGLRLKSRYLPNLPLFEWAMDFLFTNLLFFGSMGLAAKTCKVSTDVSSRCSAAYESKDYHKAQASVAFGFLASFVFIASAIIAFRRVRKTA